MMQIKYIDIKLSFFPKSHLLSEKKSFPHVDDCQATIAWKPYRIDMQFLGIGILNSRNNPKILI